MELIKEEAALEDNSRGRQRGGLTSVVSSKQVQRNQLEIFRVWCMEIHILCAAAGIGVIRSPSLVTQNVTTAFLRTNK